MLKHFVVIFIICFFSCNHDTPKPSTPQPCNASYANDIKPFIGTKCAISGCHGYNGLADLKDYSTLKARVENGKVKKYVFELKTMPPSTSAQLSDAEKTKLQCWLDDGAPEN